MSTLPCWPVTNNGSGGRELEQWITYECLAAYTSSSCGTLFRAPSKSPRMLCCSLKASTGKTRGPSSAEADDEHPPLLAKPSKPGQQGNKAITITSIARAIYWAANRLYQALRGI